MTDTEEANFNDASVTVALNTIPAERQVSLRERLHELSCTPRVKETLQRARHVVTCVIVIFSIALLVRGVVQGSPADITTSIELAKSIAQKPTALGIQQSTWTNNLTINLTKP